MKRLKITCIVALGLAAAVAALTLGGSLLGHTAGNPQAINVNVANLPTNPIPLRDVDNPAKQPFQEYKEITLGNGTASGDFTFTVTTGKRLVIEFCSVYAETFDGQVPSLKIMPQANPEQFFCVALVKQGTLAYLIPKDIFAASQPMRLYANAGDTVKLSASREGAHGPDHVATFFIGISGYLVDMP